MTMIQQTQRLAEQSARVQPDSDRTTLREKFPARTVPASWPATEQSADEITRRLNLPPIAVGQPEMLRSRRRGLNLLLQWLEGQPGVTWQERWKASGAEQMPKQEWLTLPANWPTTTPFRRHDVLAGLLLLVCGDVIRPDPAWMLGRRSAHLARAMEQARDPKGFASLRTQCEALGVPTLTFNAALYRVAVVLACKGGTVADITVGDCVEFLDVRDTTQRGAGTDKTAFYLLLREAGVLSPDAPPTIRAFRAAHGQLSIEALVDRHELAYKPMRDLLVDYLKERQPSIDYSTLTDLVQNLIGLFWKDLEIHHPGIASLRLPPDVATAWKLRLQTKTTKTKDPSGLLTMVASPRENVRTVLIKVRAFYLDLAQWAADDPARWGPWVATCPITAAETNQRKHSNRRKAKMDQRTRERLPVLPALIRAAHQRRDDAMALLQTAQQAEPGAVFTAAGQSLLRPVMRGAGVKVWARELDAPPGNARSSRRDISNEEHNAFWGWAAIEVLRHTGIRVEELCELSHHSLIQYKVPATGELVPLLQIAPSKTDVERLLLVGPELADVLSQIILRIRDANGAVPQVPAYDYAERLWIPPMPLLFQHRVGIEMRALPATAIRKFLDATLAATGLTDASGNIVQFQPHDFRRIFITDAIMNGMPPHIAQIVAGHTNINTTMGYKAVYPMEAIEAHRAFIARRRATRPGEEYRLPTDEEWDSFLGHFEKRKLSIGTCGRAFGTPCIHEHACVRCSMLRPDPNERPRLVEIRDNLRDRIDEARREGWLGEVEGLETSLAGAEEKLAQMDASLARTTTAVDLGIPTFNQIASRTIDAKKPTS